MEPSKEISCELVIAGGDSAKVLQFVEETFDEITLAVKSKIAGQRRLAARVRRNHRSDLSLVEDVDESVGIESMSAMSARGSTFSSNGSAQTRS